MGRKLLFTSSSLVALSCASIAFSQSSTEEFTYDALGRLITSESTSGPNDDEVRSTCYDELGNRVEFVTRDDGTSANCAAPSPQPAPAPTPSPTPTPPPNPETNNPPNAVDDSFTGDCNDPVLFNVTVNDSDPDGNTPLSVTDVTVTSGDADIDDISWFGGTIEFESPEGISVLEYTVSDTLGATDTANLTIDCLDE